MVCMLIIAFLFTVFGAVELEAYPALVVEKLLRALKLNSSEARLKFPRLLQIIEQYPEETLNIMTKEVGILESGRELSGIKDTRLFISRLSVCNIHTHVLAFFFFFNLCVYTHATSCLWRSENNPGYHYSPSAMFVIWCDPPVSPCV